MTRLKIVMLLTLLSAWGYPSAPARGGDDFSAVLKQMPSTYPVAIVVRDLTKLQKSAQAWQTRLDPAGEPPDMINDLKGELGIGEWIDFAAPIGLAAPSFGPGGGEGLLWVRVPGFAERVKTVEGATETEGIWELPFTDNDTLFAKINGDYAMVSTQKSMLPTFAPDATTLHAETKSRGDLFSGRDVLIHVNFEPLRPMMLGGLAQASQMIGPMMAMAMAQGGGGGDTAGMSAMMNGLVDGLKQFAEQVLFLDIAVTLGDEDANITLATGFSDGAIKTYLANQKPATATLLENLEEQPFFAAFGYHFPGEASPVVDYFYGKALAALPAPPEGEVDAGDPASPTNAMRENLKASRELYRQVSGMNTLYAFGPDGMRGVGDFVVKDPKGAAELLKKTLTQANSAMMQFGGGVNFESRGEKKVGETAVEEFAVKVDTTSPTGAMAMQIYGANARMAVGALSDRVRFVMGNDDYVTRCFGKADKMLIDTAATKATLAALPAKRNVVGLVDPAGFLPVLGPMIGIGKVDAVPPGAPIGFSMSLSGDTARVDLHVPIRAIERVMQAAAEDEPM